MLKIFKNELNNEMVKKINSIEDNCWINLIKPTNDEIKRKLMQLVSARDGVQDKIIEELKIMKEEE